MNKSILIVAGEASGDMHSASIISELKKLDPSIKISAMGGEKMRSSGAEIIIDIRELSIIGFTGVIRNIKKINQAFQRILHEINTKRPAAVVLVDYPGFNLKLAKILKGKGIPVIYFISPQIWAWWKGRIHSIKQFVDKMIVIFKFEEKLYKNAGIDVSFVGHPLIDKTKTDLQEKDFLKTINLSPHKETIGLIPGSRKTEVERILPVILETAKQINRERPQTQFIISKAPSLTKDLFETRLKKYSFPAAICENNIYNILNACNFVLVASGTATLETAIMRKPMAIIYKVSFLNWLIARHLIKIPYIGLVNIVAGKKIVPEFVQFQAKPRLIAQETISTLCNEEKITQIKSDLKKVREKLGAPGACKKTAELILRFIESASHE